MMECESSKSKGGGAEGPSQVGTGTDSQIGVDSSSYQAARRRDPALQRFDAALHERTNHDIAILAAGSGIESLSSDSLKEVIGCLLETNQDAAPVILQCQKDKWNPDLFSLAEEYSENCKMTLEFCTALENCLKRARTNQSIIQLSIKHFKEELGLEVGTDEKKFVKTLQELRKFKQADKLFTMEFSQLSDSVRRQQGSMLEKLLARKNKLDKKLKSLRTWRWVSNVLFVAIFVSVFIFSVVAAAKDASPGVAALAVALTVPVDSLGKWCNRLWKRYENELKRQEELIVTMDIFTKIKFAQMENIRVLVSRLEIYIESLLHNTDFALQEDEVKLAIDEIKRELGVFMETIEILDRQAHMCSRHAWMAWTVVTQSMVRRSGSSATGDSPWGL